MATDPAPKKSLGQHWLNDPAYLAGVVAAADLIPEDVVLEIGPGQGALTNLLAEQASRVIAVEVDTELANSLQQKVAANVSVVAQDIRNFDANQLPTGYKVVANIPYYLTGHIIRQLLELPNKPARIVLLIQKEVAERILAEPGKMSVLSVAVAFYASRSGGEVVPAAAFEPPPKVDSQVIILEPHATPNVDEKHFFRIVQAGFGEKRKKLANSLAGGLQLDKQTVANLISELEWSKNVRAQELSVEDWLQLYDRLQS